MTDVWLGRADNLSVLSGAPGEVHICAHRGTQTVAFTIGVKQMNLLVEALGNAADEVGESLVHPAFTCPRCQRSSYSPIDLVEGYCGACHDWTATR